MEALWYFAYGSNLQRATLEGRRGLRPLDTRPGRLDGYRLSFDLPVGPGERGAANVYPDATTSVHGVAYLLTAPDAERLDRTEGVPQGWYLRITVDVLAAAGVLNAFTYRSVHGVEGRKPSARYLGLILEGARTHGLPDAWVGWLAAHELAVDEREPRSD